MKTLEKSKRDGVRDRLLAKGLGAADVAVILGDDTKTVDEIVQACKDYCNRQVKTKVPPKDDVEPVAVEPVAIKARVDYFVIFPSERSVSVPGEQRRHPVEAWVAVGLTLADTIPVPAPIQVFTVAQAKAWLKLGRAVQVSRDLVEALGFSSS